MSKLFLHAGYHKTGTTFLQKQVFSKIAGLNYLGRSWKNDELNRFFKDFAFTSDVDFNATEESSRFEDICNRYFQRSGLNPSLPALVSHESLMTGPEWFGSEVMSRAIRLKDTFPEARMIIGIRNQADFIDSNYRQYVILGGKLTFDRFLNQSMAASYGLLPRLEYDKVIQRYSDLFGPENIHVYLLEDLKENSADVVAKLLSFMGISEPVTPAIRDTNKGISRFSINSIRLINKLMLDDFSEQYYRWVNQDVSRTESLRWRLVRLLKRLEKNGRPGHFVTENHRAQIKERFRSSNERLAILLQKDIHRLGY